MRNATPGETHLLDRNEAGLVYKLITKEKKHEKSLKLTKSVS